MTTTMTVTRATGLATPVGALTLRPLPDDLDDGTAQMLHGWLTDPRSRYWGMQGWSPEQVRGAFTDIRETAGHTAWLGRRDGHPCFLAETYDPAAHELAGHLDVRSGDLGMHVLVAPPDGPPTRGLTTWVMQTVLTLCFRDHGVDRVVVEPDVRNQVVHRKNAEAGFQVVCDVALSDKTARLSTCSRASFEAHRRQLSLPPVDSTDHLAPVHLDSAQRRLVAKALAELAHERVVAPEPGEDGRYVVQAPVVRYTFAARVMPLEHWVVDPESVRRLADGRETALDAARLVLDLQGRLGIGDGMLPTYLQEIQATVAGLAYKHAHQLLDADDLAGASLQDVERSMTEGHPGFVANSGRTGLGLGDLHRYAPESGRPVRLRWVAVRRDESELSLGSDRTEAQHYLDEVHERDLARFEHAVTTVGGRVDDYRLLPLHPWQWERQVCTTFAPEVAAGKVLDVGPSTDRFQAQQSIRTFYNLDHPGRSYVKTALAVQNMGFVRGLSAHYMRATPAINDWVASLVCTDPALRATGVDVSTEHAAIGMVGHTFAGLPGDVPQQKMLAALWRESPHRRLQAGERAVTLASVLHRDTSGRSLAAAWIRRSGVAPRAWVERLVHAYVWPLVHCLVEHQLAFMPHGENVIMVMRDDVPVRVLLKDIGEEVAVLGDRELPPEVERIRADVPLDHRALAIQTDVLDGVLRHLGALLDIERLLPVATFWEVVRDVVEGHRQDFPSGHADVDLWSPEFDHSCLNRLQLRHAARMVDLADQESSLIFAGTLRNPLAT